jgi:hypothetical protein
MSAISRHRAIVVVYFGVALTEFRHCGFVAASSIASQSHKQASCSFTTAKVVRLEYDKRVCEALGVRVSKKTLLALYKIFVEEMILTRGLIKD